MLAATPELIGDVATIAGAIVAVSAACVALAQLVRWIVTSALHPQLAAIDRKIDQLSAENTAQHVANANAARGRDDQINHRIDALTDELRQAGDRFEKRIIVIEETVTDHIANKVVHAR